MVRWLAGLVVLATACASFAAEPATGTRVAERVHSKLFRHQYSIYDRSFCGSEVCVDFDGDGRRELLYATRGPCKLSMLDAADGTTRWSQTLPGEQQSTSAFDLDGDGRWEIVYTASSPGRLYVLDHEGHVLRQWDSGDSKLGNSPVILDADGDGVLDGFLGTRSRYLTRLNMRDLSLLARREGWVQCGCHTSALDVDGDGKWDLFAGSGDDFAAKGVLHRIDPLTLDSVWSHATNDNASSADAVLVDLDGDGRVEIVKSIDNYKQDDAHDGVFAFRTDGTLLWKREGLAGEDSPNVADLDGDGKVEIVGMTFGGEVYCLDARGQIRWRRDLRPELGDDTHMYMAPILCDLNGDSQLEILAMTNGGYAQTGQDAPTARLHALNARGELLDELDLGEPRYWGHAFVCNLDDDPYQELIISGSGGLDVIETRGFGPNNEHFQRRRSYQRLNVRPWAYEDNYFLERGHRENVVHAADNLVLARNDSGYVSKGQFVTHLLTLPPDGEFHHCRVDAVRPRGTGLQVDLLAADGRVLRRVTSPEDVAGVREPVRLAFTLSTSHPDQSPRLDSYSLSFQRGVTTVAAAPDQPTAAAMGSTLVVEAGERRTDAVAVVPLSVTEKELRSLGLVEIVDEKSLPVVCQVERNNPPRLWWLVKGELPAAVPRTFRLVSKDAAPKAAVKVEPAGGGVSIRVGELPVLQYNAEHVAPPQGIDAAYGRSAFIHPLHTPSGAVVTDQFPLDHAHQSGIFLAHTKTEFEGRTPNFWDLLGGTGRVRFRSMEAAQGGPLFGEMRVAHEHVDLSSGEAKPALHETWLVRVWSIGGREAGYWICDITSTLECASASPLRLKQYHYGGMALRGAREWDATHGRFLTSEGHDRIAGNHTRPRWCDLSGPVGNQRAGLALMTHPQNFRAPEPLRIHPTMPYMVYSPSHLGDWEITPGAPHVSRYRFVAYDGELPTATLDQLWRNFAEPLQPTIVATDDVR